MKTYLTRFVKLLIGLFLFALGVVVTNQSNFGSPPWEVLSTGIANHIPLKLGTINIAIGLVMLLLDFLFRESIGLGTVFNMFMVGLYMNLLYDINIVPVQSVWYFMLLQMVVGMFVTALGMFFYMRTSFGAGPRDTMMVAVARKMKVSVGIGKVALELAVVVLGFLLGGKFGLGTVVNMLFGGASVQLVFKLFRFDAKAIQHESLMDTYQNLRALASKNAPPEQAPEQPEAQPSEQPEAAPDSDPHSYNRGDR